METQFDYYRLPQLSYYKNNNRDANTNNIHRCVTDMNPRSTTYMNAHHKKLF